MEANELRIGNLVDVKKNDYLLTYIVNCKVESINIEGINSYYDDGIGGDNWEYGGKFEELIPIPLTEEWLFKLGFKKDQNNRYVTTNWSGLYLELKSQWYLMRATNEANIEICYGFKHVHQLQNLYFALTGEELTPQGFNSPNK
jgi:hypothetical protein